MLSETLLFNVTCLANEPFLRQRGEERIKMAQLNTNNKIRKTMPLWRKHSISDYWETKKLKHLTHKIFGFFFYLLLVPHSFFSSMNDFAWSAYLNCQFGWKIITVIISSCFKQWGSILLRQLVVSRMLNCENNLFECYFLHPLTRIMVLCIWIDIASFTCRMSSLLEHLTA